MKGLTEIYEPTNAEFSPNSAENASDLPEKGVSYHNDIDFSTLYHSIKSKWSISKFEKSAIIADEWHKLQEICRIRYEFYCERDGKRYAGADHKRKIFIEPVDFKSLNFYISQGNTCGLAARLTWSNDVEEGQLAEALAHSGIPAEELPRTTIASRLVARPDFGARAAMVPLMRAM